MQKINQKIVLRISRDDKQYGIIYFDVENIITFSENISEELRETVALALQEGVPMQAAVYKNNSHLTIQKMITSKHLLFPLAFIKFLEEKGYTIDRRHPEVEAEIISLLADFPDSDENKKKILSNVDTMSYLEQSAILEELKNN